MAVKKWRGKWVVDLKIDGRRVRRVSPDQTKAGAKRYEAELLLGLSTPQSCSGPAEGRAQGGGECPTLAEFAPEWLVTYAVPNNKPSERARKESILRVHLVPFFGNRRLDAISPLLIERFKAEQLQEGLKASTINSQLIVLQKLLRTAVEWGHFERRDDVWRIRRLPTDERQFDWLRPDEAGLLLRAAKEMSAKWYTFFFVALRTGMRRGEILALHWDEVDFERRRITVRYTNWQGRLGSPKSGRIRVVPMTGDLAEALHAWRSTGVGTSPLVFPNRRGDLTNWHSGAGRALDRALERAGLRHIRLHDLRHSFASHLVLKRCSLREVQILMGHHSIRMTERYAHITDDRLASAIDVLDGLGLSGGGEGMHPA